MYKNYIIKDLKYKGGVNHRPYLFKNMFIISFDLGSSNFKAIIMKIEKDEITLAGKIRKNEDNFLSFADFVFDKFNIDKDKVEKIIATGTGSSYIENNYKEIEIIKVNEFDAIGYGGLILSKNEEGIVVSIGTGTAFIYSNMIENKHIGGTGLGGGTFVGLSNRLFNNKMLSFRELIDMTKGGTSKNVDFKIGDISKDDIGILKKDITAANFAAIKKKPSDKDIVNGIANMILENICLLANLHKKLLLKDEKSKMPIIFIGTMVDDAYIKSLIKNISDFTKDEYTFVENTEYAIAIGAYEYYLLRLRKII